jgi:protein phosphatase
LNVCAFTHIGKRKNQEDRFVLCPDLLGGEYAFFGVFDGTVKEHASEWIHKHILPILIQTKSFRKFHALSKAEKLSSLDILEAAVRELYAQTDDQCVKAMGQKEYHYASTTAVTALIHFPSNVIIIANLGDSHAVTGAFTSSSSDSKDKQPRLVGKFVTSPHRADDPKERKRIEEAGGSVVYLHDKPFIRGGDFHKRDHAMQLNYSRAFGGKDLKSYGLSPIPDVHITRVNFDIDEKSAMASQDEKDRVRILLMGSDGIWDVISPDDAVGLAYASHKQFLKFFQQDKAKIVDQQRPASPAECLAHLALKNHKQKGSNDNVTCIAVFL